MLRLPVAAEPDTPRPPGDAAVPATRTAARPSVPRARPALSAREAQALRETLLLRQALAARPDLTPEQLTALRAAASTATRTGSSGQPGRRTSTVRPGTRRAPARKPVPRTRSARPPQKSPEKGPEKGRPRVGWWTRLGVIAMSTVLLPAVASLALPGAPDSGKNAPLDVTTLALTARSSLLEKADEYRALQQEVAQRSTELHQARDAAQAARDQVAAEQEIVGTTAASLYRADAAQRLPLLGLSVHDGATTSDVLFRQALADRADRALEAALVRAERRGAVLQRATERLAAAQAPAQTTPRRPPPRGPGRRRDHQPSGRQCARHGAGAGRRPEPRGERHAGRTEHHPRRRGTAGPQPAGHAALAGLPRPAGGGRDRGAAGG